MTKKDLYVLAASVAQAYVECDNASQRNGAKKVIEHISHALMIEKQTVDFDKAVVEMIKYLHH